MTLWRSPVRHLPGLPFKGMNKLEAIKICLRLENDKAEALLNKKSYTNYESFVSVLSRPSYNLAKDLGCSAVTVSRLMSELFPGKPKNTTKACTYLLNKHGFKYCARCEEVKSTSEFHSNSSRKNGLGSQCIDCHYEQLKVYQPAVTANYRAAKLNRTPSWADLDKIKEIYDNCPEGHHVDHEVPLQGNNVCGLHVEYNLQYLTSKANLQKGNLWQIS